MFIMMFGQKKRRREAHKVWGETARRLGFLAQDRPRGMAGIADSFETIIAQYKFFHDLSLIFLS